MSVRPATVFLAATLLLSCTGPGNEGSVSSARPKIARFPHSVANADCFLHRRIDNFEVLNDSNLLVFDGRRRVYHVEIAPPSLDLRHAYGIEFSSGTGRVCGNAGERLYVRNGSISRFPLSVLGVHRLDEPLQASVRAHFGQATALPALPEDDDASAVEELVTDLEGTTEDAGDDSPSAAAEPNPEN